jgi:hypothetical protein
MKTLNELLDHQMGVLSEQQLTVYITDLKDEELLDKWTSFLDTVTLSADVWDEAVDAINAIVGGLSEWNCVGYEYADEYEEEVDYDAEDREILFVFLPEGYHFDQI